MRPAFAKPVKRSTVKRKRDQAEAKVKQTIRQQCVERDGYCRVFQAVEASGASGLSECDGPSEWAHFGTKKRAHTRGMAPQARHTTADSLMLCRWHHYRYDAGRLTILAQGVVGCDGALVMRET